MALHPVLTLFVQTNGDQQDSRTAIFILQKEKRGYCLQSQQNTNYGTSIQHPLVIILGRRRATGLPTVCTVDYGSSCKNETETRNCIQIRKLQISLHLAVSVTLN